MKKILTTAMVLGSLMNVANAMETITSPLYMPKDGEVISHTEAGNFNQDSKIDYVATGTADESDELDMYIVNEDASFGVNDSLSIDFGFYFLTNQEDRLTYTDNTINEEYKNSNEVDGFYIGGTKRLYDDQFKLDVGGVLHQDEAVEGFARAGFVWDRFHIALTGGALYNWGTEERVTNNGTAVSQDKEESYATFYAALEHEIELAKDYIFVGLDLAYVRTGDQVVDRTTGATGATIAKVRKENTDAWTINADINYKINEYFTVGAYGRYTEVSDQEVHLNSAHNYTEKDNDTKEFGLKLDTMF